MLPYIGAKGTRKHYIHVIKLIQGPCWGNIGRVLFFVVKLINVKKKKKAWPLFSNFEKLNTMFIITALLGVSNGIYEHLRACEQCVYFCEYELQWSHFSCEQRAFYKIWMASSEHFVNFLLVGISLLLKGNVVLRQAIWLTPSKQDTWWARTRFNQSHQLTSKLRHVASRE